MDSVDFGPKSRKGTRPEVDVARFVLGKRHKYIEPGLNFHRDLQIMHKSENDAFRSKAKILLIVSLLHFR